jgi:ribonuclease P protein component
VRKRKTNPAVQEQHQLTGDPLAPIRRLTGPSQRFRPEQRLGKSRDFQRVFQQRCSVADELLIVYARPNSLNIGRLGMSVSRRVGKAHVRNRWKRLIREVYRRNALLAVGLDLVVIPRPETACDFRSISASLPRLIERLHRKLKVST